LTQWCLFCDDLCKFIHPMENSLTVLMSHPTLYDEDRNVSHLRGTLPENKFKAQIFDSLVVAIVFWDSEGNWLWISWGKMPQSIPSNTYRH
jgi:hypothetical protein